MAGGRDLELDRPRGAPQLIGATFQVYSRFPLLFLALAAAVLVPYEAVVLLATGTGPLARGQDSFGLGLALTVADFALVTPLISALHVHAVQDVQAGRRPELAAVTKRGLTTLPVVSAAVVISWLGITLGFIALIVPGVILLLRWSVAAQAAALDGGGWQDALRRSTALARDQYLHVFGLLFLVEAITFIPGFVALRAFGDTDTTAASFLVDVALQIVLRSFTALATALLFFELRARLEEGSAEAESTPASRDPGSYTDEDRPPGWYVDPDAPRRMRYWAADGQPGWSKRTTKTPKKVLAEWRDLRWAREQPPA